eukprot:5290105-Pyramimonas_sp.AAC.3
MTRALRRAQDGPGGLQEVAPRGFQDIPQKCPPEESTDLLVGSTRSAGYCRVRAECRVLQGLRRSPVERVGRGATNEV